MDLLAKQNPPKVGFDMGSGDREPGGDVQTFNQLFPLGHAYLGYIDTIGRQNIIDVSAGVSVTPLERTTVGVTGHFFWRHEKSDALYNAGERSTVPDVPLTRAPLTLAPL